jgi:hypothetical protein
MFNRKRRFIRQIRIDFSSSPFSGSSIRTVFLDQTRLPIFKVYYLSITIYGGKGRQVDVSLFRVGTASLGFLVIFITAVLQIGFNNWTISGNLVGCTCIIIYCSAVLRPPFPPVVVCWCFQGRCFEKSSSGRRSCSRSSTETHKHVQTKHSHF